VKTNRSYLYSKQKPRLNHRRISYYSSSNKKRVKHYSEAVFPKTRSLNFAKIKNKSLYKFYKIVFKFLGLPLILFLASLIITQLDYFKIDRLTYEGLKAVSHDDVENFLQSNLKESKKIYFFSSDNYFLTDSEKLELLLKEKFPFNSVKVKKDFPNALHFTFQEKISTVIYTNGKKFYLLDQNGEFIRPLTLLINQNISTPSSTTSTIDFPTSSQKINSDNFLAEIPKFGKEFEGLPVLFDKQSKNISEIPKEKVLTSSTIQTAINWQALFEKQKISNIKYFIFENDNSGLEVASQFPWKIYVNPQNNLENQLNNLKLILKENKPNEYVDLRYEGRVYWK